MDKLTLSNTLQTKSVIYLVSMIEYNQPMTDLLMFYLFLMILIGVSMYKHFTTEKRHDNTE